MLPLRVKYQVFISSTPGDLREECDAVRWEILKARHIPAGLEIFPSTDDRGWKIIQRTIDDSDYYVLLLAGRYGSTDRETGLSWTERAYDYARTKRIPVLAFIRSDTHITADEVDADDAPKLEAFKQKIRDAQHTESFTTTVDLSAKFAAALHRAIIDDRTDVSAWGGWVRGDVVPRDALEEISRLLRENRDLRAQVETLGGARAPALALALDDGSEVATIQLSHPRYVPPDGPVTANAPYTPTRSGPTAMDMAVEATRTFWLALQLKNTGNAPARNARIKFEINGVRAVALNKFVTSPVRPVDSWYLNPSSPVYVNGRPREEETNIVRLEQRVQNLGVGQEERLVRMGLTLAEDFFLGQGVDLSIVYDAADESGARSRGEFWVRCTLIGEETLDEETFEKI